MNRSEVQAEDTDELENLKGWHALTIWGIIVIFDRNASKFTEVVGTPS